MMNYTVKKLNTERVEDDYLTHFSHVSSRYQYFYLATPKVASSSLLMTLQRMELGDASFTHSPISLVHDRGHSSLAGLTLPGDIHKALAGLLKFCIVRNPVDRLLSAYLDKVLPPNGGLGAMVSETLGLDKAAPISFEHFLSAVRTQAPCDMDPHYAIQYVHTAQSIIEYDLILRFENLQHDLLVLGRLLNVDLAKWEARVDHHSTGVKDYTALLTPHAMDLMREIFEADFETFGYLSNLAAYVR